MTRAQKTAKLHKLKVAMNRGKSARTSYDDDNTSISSNDTNPLNDERFIVEGDPDSLVREYSKELTMQDIRDFTDNTFTDNTGRDNNGKSMDNNGKLSKRKNDRHHHFII